MTQRVNPAAELSEKERATVQEAAWAAGYGAIAHRDETRERVRAMARTLAREEVRGDGAAVFELLWAADRLASAAMWLVVHETYARNVYLDGRPLAAEDFKPNPEGHTGGALNMVPAYVGYLAANALTGQTRAWIMGQGHTVAALDSVNLLVGNMTAAHAERYDITDEGLTRYVRDFYSYLLNERGEQDSPLGSHVNAHTAGGLVEGGYLGFTELQYVHMPLAGESLVTFLSDGAFEEQRGSDWVPRWWRAADCGLVVPIMIKNGRRIDQRTTLSQQGGVDWFVEHLRLNSFDPIVFDGRDPAAFTWAIWEIERRLRAQAEAVERGERDYPVALPYGIAVAPKGAGFFGEGTNLAHNLPLFANPSIDEVAARRFNESARRLWVPVPELRQAIGLFQQHETSGRPPEREHPLVDRRVSLESVPPPISRPVPEDRSDPAAWTRASPMTAIDETFVAFVRANPHLRPRVGNPDEMRSNRLVEILELLKFRVTDPEPEIPESTHGAVITALNEEAVVAAALANKGGISLAHTYEAFGPKMLGAMRQEIIFADQCVRAGREQRWLSIPLILTSHTWENAKNELSHQDPAMAEALMGESSHISRVVFLADFNSAAATLRAVYLSHGQFWTIVATKQDTAPDLFRPDEVERLLETGALRLEWTGHRVDDAALVLTALGSYQLEQALRASRRLSERDVPHAVNYMFEPGRFRAPRNEREAAHVASDDVVRNLFPDQAGVRVFVSHTRPEPLLGVLQPLNTGWGRCRALGFIGEGGTLTPEGMLFVNRSTWAHIVAEAAAGLGRPVEDVLTEEEIAAISGRRSPHGIVI